MSITLDKILFTKGVAVAALVNCSVHRVDCSRSLAVYCAKRPVAVLIRREGVTAAFDLDGRRIELDALERLYPGQRAAFERLAG